MFTGERASALLPALSDELAGLAERVAASVVAVKGSRYGMGSGVVWDRRGLVVTNHHVVPGEWAELELATGQRLRARVAARDERLDLAALRLVEVGEPDGLVAAEIGDSSRLRVGELVLAVGNPQGERNAVTLGIVSALEPTPGPGGALQLAITLRPGNSGGALADARGRVVGIPHMVTGHRAGRAVPSQEVEAFLRRAGAGGPERVGGPIRWV